jgi:transcriptional regulator with XRE-family HTH domain
MSAEDSRVGQLIRRDREARCLTRRDLAELVGISTSHLRNVENGNRRVTPHLAEQLAAVLDLDPDRYQPRHRGGDDA